MSREPLRSYSSSLTPFADPYCQVRNRHLALNHSPPAPPPPTSPLQNICLVGDHFRSRALGVCSSHMCACVPVNVGLCVMRLSLPFEAVPVSQSVVSRPLPWLPTPHPQKGGRPSVHLEQNATVVHQETRVWKLALLFPPAQRKRHGSVLYLSISVVLVSLPSGLSLPCFLGCTGANLDPRMTPNR